MKFECGDLERAFANPDLMRDASEHLKSCDACRREYRLWMAISTVGRELHEEWDAPGLWPKIRQSLEAERKPEGQRWGGWKTWCVAAALVATLAGAVVFERLPRQPPAAAPNVAAGGSRDFLTEQALKEVENNEAAYRKSIERLAQLAEPKLEKSASASAVNAREKLLMLDSAIVDTRNNVASNRFNVHLQTTLSQLYREKQHTLEEVLNQ